MQVQAAQVTIDQMAALLESTTVTREARAAEIYARWLQKPCGDTVILIEGVNGKGAWNTGLTASDHASVAAVSAKMKGRVVGDDTREKQAAAKRGKVGPESNRWTGRASKVGPYSQHRSTIFGRRVYVHRYVAEQSIGRMLTRDEHVHHIDRDESNNAPLNLLVVSESDHARLHGGIYRGECDTRDEQIAWLNAAGIAYLEIQ